MSNYVFPAVVSTVKLASKKVDQFIGEGPKGKPIIEKIEVPSLTLTLTYTDERAAQIAAMLTNWQGMEVTLELEGEGRQLNLM